MKLLILLFSRVLLVAIIIAPSLSTAEQRAPEFTQAEYFFVALMASAMHASDVAITDAQRKNILLERNDEVCNMLDHGKVFSWTGNIHKSSGAKENSLSLVIAGHIALDINDVASDSNKKYVTLSNTSRELMYYPQGTTVHFSGNFISGKSSCVKDNSSSTTEQLINPHFAFKISDFKVISVG